MVNIPDAVLPVISKIDELVNTHPLTLSVTEHSKVQLPTVIPEVLLLTLLSTPLANVVL
jgi:hypothetical protein